MGSPKEFIDATALVRDLHRANPRVYWVDFLMSAAVGWGGFAVAVVAPDLVTAAAGYVAAVLGLYRCLSFIHELSHLSAAAVPGFAAAWEALAGTPLMVPTCFYGSVHREHHSLAAYGTHADPEYISLSGRRSLIILSFTHAALLPLLMVVRFFALTPLAWASPKARAFTDIVASSLVMNVSYRRNVSQADTVSIRRAEFRVWVFWGSVGGLIACGVLPVTVLGVWAIVLTTISILNHIRALAAHRYERGGDEPADRKTQLTDSINTVGSPVAALLAPVGLRYHALHHLFPGIPYHNLGLAHRRLMLHLPPEALYRAVNRATLLESLDSVWCGRRLAVEPSKPVLPAAKPNLIERVGKVLVEGEGKTHNRS